MVWRSMLPARSVLVLASVGLFRIFGFFTNPTLTDAQIHAIVSDPAPSSPSELEAPAAPDRPITVVSWNIDRGSHFEAIASALERLGPDVVLLQEVDRYCKRSGNRDVGRDLAQRLHMHWVSGGEFQEIGESRD